MLEAAPTMDSRNTFSVYSDETGLFDKRFQAIALVSGPSVVLLDLRQRLRAILEQNGVDEIKFSEIRTHRPKLLTAQGFIECSVREYANQEKCRIDVLIWDTQDLRHTIRGRDDVANVRIMYYRLLTHAARQWKQAEWYFYPDMNPEIDWNEIADFLSRTSLSPSATNLPPLFDLDIRGQLIKFSEIRPTDSLFEPLIQLADLFAGMARFSREEGDACVQWLDSWGNKEQLELPDFIHAMDAIDETIETKQNRYRLTGEFYQVCRRNRMGISLRGRRCLRTLDPRNPINFWNYEPQHTHDHAPIRGNV